MTVTTTPHQARTPYDEWLDRRWRLTGAFVGLVALVVAALLVASGEKRSDYGDLLDAGVAVWLAVLLLIVGGPEPWRATRWAWGWVVLLAGPLGSVAYLLLGGPLALLRPHAGHRRLTGGWAFLLAWFLFAGWRETDGG